MNHVVSYTPGDRAPRDHGPVAIKNPDDTPFIDKAGKPLPFHAGTFKTPDGETKAGGVYILMLGPYTVLVIAPGEVK